MGTTRHDESFDGQTRVAEVMVGAAKEWPDFRPDEDRLIAIVDSEEEAGIVTYGFESVEQAIDAIVSASRSIMNANGYELQVIGPLDKPIGGQG